VAVIGLGCAGALVIYSRHQPEKTVPSAAAPLKDPTATSQSSGLKVLRFNAKKDGADTEIAAALETTYADGRSRWSQMQMTTKRNEHTFRMSADSAETKGKAVSGDEPGEIALHGNVKITTDDGLEVHTEEATYDNVQGLATMTGKVTFTKGQMSGEGVGATYDREELVAALKDPSPGVRRAAS
jgi:LPS export ABC transporter protein LptC